MSFLLAALAGFATGWFLQFLNEATEVYRRGNIDDHLNSCRPTKEDLVDWDKHNSGGRRG